MRVVDPPWKWYSKTKTTDLHSPLIAIKWNFAQDTMCGRKSWKKWTAIYWFSHKTYSAVIHGWIRQCYEAAWKLVTKWLRSSPSGNSLHVFPISPYVSLCFTHCFRSFFGCFPCFPWCFSLFPILGLTYSKDVSGRDYLILRVKYLLFLKYKRKGIYSKFIVTILNNHCSKFLLTQYRFRI